MMIDERAVWARIGEVMDPELDRPLDALGFVESVRIDGSEVVVHFRLPTYWCAPNFAYMMSSDLRERIGRVPGVEAVRVRLLDHFAEDEITAGVNAGQSFAEVFADETDGDLTELRRTFLRKAFLVRQEQLLRVCCARATRPITWRDSPRQTYGWRAMRCLCARRTRLPNGVGCQAWRAPSHTLVRSGWRRVWARWRAGRSSQQRMVSR